MLWLMLVLGNISLLTAQSIRPHVLCEDDNITVTAGSSGIITHTKRDINKPCTLILSGFNSISRVIIPEVDKSTNNQCNPGSSSVYINRVVYCVTEDNSINNLVVNLTEGYLNITLPSADVSEFAIKYYNNGK